MPLISVDYEYNLPNSYMVDHTFTEGKTRATTYDGPERIFLIVNNETGKEEFGPVTPENLADGRPLPLGCRYVEIDCVTNPLICQLRAPIIDEAEDEHTSSEPHPQSPLIPGYPQYIIQTPILVRNIYDKFRITVNEDDTLNVPVYTVNEALFGVGAFEELPDWNFVRAKRNKEITKSDGRIGEDMPQVLKDKWIAYRQLLRDLPDALKDVPPWIALKMFPVDPDNENPAVSGGVY